MKNYILSIFDSRNTCVEYPMVFKNGLSAQGMAKKISLKDTSHHVMVQSSDLKTFAVWEKGTRTEWSMLQIA